MSLRGIDVSVWNGWPFNFVTENAYGGSDFVIVKATQGTWYVNPHFDKSMSRASKDGKLLGTYHYAEGGNPISEAKHYWNIVCGWHEKAVPCLDWESVDNRSWGSATWCREFCKAYHGLSGVWPMIYVQASAVWQAASCASDCALWVAGYPDMRQDWNVPAFMYSTHPWKTYTVWQYTSGGGIDRNTASITREGWKKLAGSSKKTVKPQEPGRAVNDSGMYYRAHVENLGWLSSVRDGQTSGTTGNGYRMEALKISPPKGMVLDVKAHIQNVGWRTYKGIDGSENSGTGSSDHDPIIGTVGKSQRLEAIEIDVVKNPKGLKLSYRVHVSGYGWTGWVPAGYAAGTVGIGCAIEAIQIKAE